MTLTQLRYFLAVVRHGSISVAAQHIHVAQPALSQRLKQLEEELGEALLVRHSRGVSLTQAGEYLYAQAKEIVQRVDTLGQTFRSSQDNPFGRVRVGLSTAVNTRLCVPLIDRCSARYPNVELSLSESMSGTLLEWVQEGRIDLAVVYDVPAEAGLEVTRLGSECLYLVTSAEQWAQLSRPINLEQVLALPLILPAFPQTLRVMIEQTFQRQLGRIPNQVQDVDSTYAIKKLVAASKGYSILSQHSLQDELNRGELKIVPFASGLFERSINVANRYDVAAEVAVRAVRGVLQDIWQQIIDA